MSAPRRTSSSLLIDEQPLQVIPSLACEIGLNRAMFLQQLHYWLKKPGAHVREGRRWVFNTFEGWHKQFPFWSAEAIRKIVSQLEAKGIIETTDRFNDRKGDRTKWYTINYDLLNALFFDPEVSPEATPESPPENPPQPQNHPEKSTVQPEKSTELEPEKSTERYQESTRDYNRDSDFQSGEDAKSRVPPPQEKVAPLQKPKDLRQHAVAALMERVAAAREVGASIHSPTNEERKQFAAMFAQCSKDGYEVEVLELALDYQVAKASGEVEGEPKAWCGYRTALDRVNEGWRPVGAAGPTLSPEEERKRDEEWEEIVAEQEAMIREAMGG